MQHAASILFLAAVLGFPSPAHSDTVPLGRSSSGAPGLAQLRRGSGSSAGTGVPIIFAEPPLVESLPDVPGPPHLPDSLTAGMSSVAVGDLDGDGLADVAGVENADSVLVVRLNLGGGGYSRGERCPLALGATALVLADFDGDGRL